MYEAEQRAAKLFNLFTGLAIFIACLGLLALGAFAAERRTKEIGIRKVLGASVSRVVLLFTKESMFLIIIAFGLASPVAHLLGAAILREFRERVQPAIGIFAMTLFGSLLIALSSVGYRSFRAAIQDPGKSLRVEG